MKTKNTLSTSPKKPTEKRRMRKRRNPENPWLSRNIILEGKEITYEPVASTRREIKRPR